MTQDRGRKANPFDELGQVEKDRLTKAQLFQTHKAHGSLSIFHQLCPDNPPRVDERTGEVVRER